MTVNQYEIYWAKLDPTVGSEIQKTRPCIVITPNEMNNSIDTVIIAPLTTKSHDFPTRLRTTVEGKECWAVIDQLRAIDKSRLNEKIGELDRKDISKLKNIMKGIIPQGKPCTHRLRRFSAASRRVLNPSIPHSLDHVRASTSTVSLRSEINKMLVE